MNSDIANIWESIQYLANNYFFDSERAESFYDADFYLFENLQQQSLSFADAIINGNNNAFLVKRVGNYCVLLGFSDLYFRVCALQQNGERPRIFIDFVRDVTNFVEYHWADDYEFSTSDEEDSLSNADTESDWEWFD